MPIFFFLMSTLVYVLWLQKLLYVLYMLYVLCSTNKYVRFVDEDLKDTQNSKEKKHKTGCLGKSQMLQKKNSNKTI